MNQTYIPYLTFPKDTNRFIKITFPATVAVDNLSIETGGCGPEIRQPVKAADCELYNNIEVLMFKAIQNSSRGPEAGSILVSQRSIKILH